MRCKNGAALPAGIEAMKRDTYQLLQIVCPARCRAHCQPLPGPVCGDRPAPPSSKPLSSHATLACSTGLGDCLLCVPFAEGVGMLDPQRRLDGASRAFGSHMDSTSTGHRNAAMASPPYGHRMQADSMSQLQKTWFIVRQNVLALYYSVLLCRYGTDLHQPLGVLNQ